MEREIDNIYLDEEGYKRYIEKIEELKEKFDEVTRLISKIILDERKEEASNEYESLMITRKNLKETIESKERKLSRIIIISRQSENGYLDIGDVVKVSLTFPNGYVEEEIIELTAGDNDMSGDFSKISVNVPLGKCVYRKNVGESSSYDIREGKVVVTILEKVNTKKYLLENK